MIILNLRAVFTQNGSVKKIFSRDEFQSLGEEERLQMGLRAFTIKNQFFQEIQPEGDGFLKIQNLSVSVGKRELIRDVSVCVNFGDIKNRHPRTLSGGQKQRLVIASVSVSGKQIMLFDEPTSGLDYKNMLRVSELIQGISKRAVVFVVSHDREFIQMIANKEIRLLTV